MNRVTVYDAPQGAALRDDFTVSVRAAGGEWQKLPVYEVKVDMHRVRHASMAYFDMEGTVEVRVESRRQPIRSVAIRPLSAMVPYRHDGEAVLFTLDRPRKLSVEVNGERFSNLHLFANPMEQGAPVPGADNVLYLEPAIHRTEDIYRLAQTPKAAGGKAPDTIYFAPGMHYLEETLLRIPSGTTVYVAGGAIVIGSLVCEGVKDVSIRGRGMLVLSDFHRFSAFRGIRIVFSENIAVEGIITVDPPHYSIYLGRSRHVSIRNFKTFSTRGWSDGIDMMACSHIDIEDVFLRTSDDCIAVYGSRWDFFGDSRHIAVRDAVLWADVAHPLMIGTHGNHHGDGDTIEDILFENIDILEHHEPQPDYMGAMAINAGDQNAVRKVTYRNIRVEDFELGRLIDIRVVWNKKYNPVPGSRIEDVRFENITYNGANAVPSRIGGFDADRPVSGVCFRQLRINGELILNPEQGKIEVGGFARDISFSG
ncbi:glycosyl hydrolase family 28 protein [Paenibacillus hamazuiensis]|uniref:glycosyl hydrolase family 28 protein n=1 Tax=Paenibacillus hamazuiensis TaxID=2936508 RepID=UPI00200E8029|nr:glycosyl hydrolase family 28 protein [Paenibacillus hamazuiensis]